jgi:hypothetical protein
MLEDAVEADANMNRMGFFHYRICTPNHNLSTKKSRLLSKDAASQAITAPSGPRVG